ncbi:B3 domain-containing protein Os03g0184500-like [Ananas comosus]|uniref:B3 domain-containing protein n=1 Tax=Ananas comosus TaxID=4615 RepID=A0A199UPI0_ANACO|nr:B3 domain-containing protein Os03g0184500-like [Ananas comosus]OAY66698.1 B3 domain-containing protein [Ananas comosus]
MAKKRASSYEEVRRRTLEENKKKMEELNLRHLSVLVRKDAATPKPSPAKQRKRRVVEEGYFTSPRRSPRLANLPDSELSEVSLHTKERPSRVLRRTYRRLNFSDRPYASYESKISAQRKAEEVESQLDPKFPSFVKLMLHSHVIRGFWLGLPKHFCDSYLPKHDATITLVDEEGDEFETNYLAYKAGLSGGWQGFSVFHELIDGDALVFQLIEPTKFKVYIIRAGGCDQLMPKEISQVQV